MKLVGHMNAIAGQREALEEYSPERGLVTSDMIALVRDAYSFEVFPHGTPLQPQGQPLVFQGGRYVEDNDEFAINAIIMEPSGTIVQATNTSQAAIVLADIARRLDEGLGFRLRNNKRPIIYISNVVVEFEEALEVKIQSLSKIASLINRARAVSPEFNITRLGFGVPMFHGPPDQISTVEATEFSIERRVQIPFEQNRYFCVAPLRTEDHIRVLTEIEDALRDIGN
jgi:hypothetical protein